VVKHLPYNTKVKCSSPVTAAGAERERMPKMFKSQTLPVPVAQ
jgi:hypothetical protein